MSESNMQCRHVKSGMHPPNMTLRYPVTGWSHVEASTELCVLCSRAIIATLEHLEAEKDVDYKRTLRDMLAAMHEASVAAPEKAEPDRRTKWVCGSCTRDKGTCQCGAPESC